jgi:ribA/ribD-fused uncharacterized protein
VKDKNAKKQIESIENEQNLSVEQSSVPSVDVVQSIDPIIDSFRGDFSFLTNFYRSTIYYDGEKYPTVEHAYQAAKTLDPKMRTMIRTAKTPGIAKILGRSVTLRPDWDSIKMHVMRTCIKKKFENPFMKPLLLATGNAKLVEGNTWGDREWGVYQGEGKNLLGKILMEVRDELRKDDL